ncbi:ECF RNA polymerase sigma factor SigJ [Planctomycetes bacterium K2D]|uniref:ECF RNA polymerase sigma factor SigJ n=2 Tax=Botrimarina mediterranea TaxID=2528022 RepID=A0A518K3D3_9BACT|nr:ECF RNA polymerase sigma factor SigJ [Botrimarina mediterranea]QDV76858.1 ECF RNA polymerase sigma factor SigJ [Planctomycetes bacterium K2D]
MSDALQELRPRLMSVAYRMLGSVVDAEDAVQDAFLRLHNTAEVASPEGFLVRATTHRCIDQLRAAKRRQTYIGPWVPEPIDTSTGGRSQALEESLSLGFLLMLERLSPTERAAFVLRTVFDYEYAEIADVLGKSEANARQIVSRAKTRLGDAAPRFRPDPKEAEGLTERFMAACRSGDVKLVEQLLAPDVEIHSDGGGKVTAARVVIQGAERAAKFLAGVFHKKQPNLEMRSTMVNGEPGVVFLQEGAVAIVLSLRIEQCVKAIYITVNPDKLTRWSLVQID